MKPLTPIEHYRNSLQNTDMVADAAQLRAVEATQRVYEQLLANTRPDSVLARLRERFAGPRASVKGLYLWGGVGRGKTRIVDSFFECLPFEDKLRIHFHRFMQRIHHELKQLKNIESPLLKVADRFARETRVICFDEFHVSDITDAMLLGGLLEAMYARGITLVATSNQPPDQLYAGGLQRDRFLPAIALLKQHCEILQVDSGVDYRLRFLDSAEIYRYPLDEQADKMLLTNFEHIAPNPGRMGRTIEIEGRKIQTVRCAEGVVWFDFPAICDGPRGAADYIEIGRQFQTVLIANVPQLGEDRNDQAKRFITLVDEFYDRHVKLIVTAAVPVHALYTGRRLKDSFDRTVSRLIEMQSHDYLALEHLSG
jgi:cell division protein ZapE